MEAIAIGLEVIAIGLEAIAIGLEAIGIGLEAIVKIGHVNILKVPSCEHHSWHQAPNLGRRMSTWGFQRRAPCIAKKQ